MKSLNQKLLRDAWQLRGQILACAVVVAIGVAAFFASFSMYRSLVASQRAYYTQYRFADVFATLKRAPDSLTARLRAVPGVAALETRIVVGVNLDVPNLDEPARGRVVSLPAAETRAEESALNLIHLRAGRKPESAHTREVVVSEAFAKANALGLGAQLGAVINGRWQRLTVVGIAVSPEYIYEAGPGVLMPDNRRFGVLWMDRQALAAAFDMRSAFNDVTATLAPGASVRAVLADFDRLLAPYGGVGASGREEHFSHRFISDEITQNRVQSVTLPMIFLAVGAFLLHTILLRQVAMQRAQIGLLKAFGYARAALIAHYLKLALLVMLLGAGGGIALGVPLRAWITRLYADFYRFPVLQLEVTTEAIVIAIALVGAAAVLAAFNAVRRAARLAPAEAMRPEPPPVYGLHAVDRSRWLQRVSPGSRIVARNLARRPLRAVASAFGIAIALAISVVGYYFHDAMDTAMNLQFAVIQREDVQVAFNEPLSVDALNNLAQLPGVTQVEPLRAVPVRLRHGHRARRVELLGLERTSQLRWVIDANAHHVPLPADGLLVNSKLAELLALQIGDEAELDVLEGERRTLRVPVAAIVAEPLGLGVYIEREQLSRLLREDQQVSGALLRVEPQDTERLYRRLKTVPAVAGVSIRAATLQTFRDVLARGFLMMAFINLMFAGAITFGLVYNGARIALSERGYELATLRVLGFTRNETAGLLLREQSALTLVGIPVGFAIGAALAWYFSLLLSTELYRIPFVLSARMLLQSLAVLLLSAAVSGAVVAWRVRRLDLIGVLKARES